LHNLYAHARTPNCASAPVTPAVNVHFLGVPHSHPPGRASHRRARAAQQPASHIEPSSAAVAAAGLAPPT